MLACHRLGQRVYVCLCHAVTERQIRELAEAGCTSLTELTMRTGCGAGCGSYREQAQGLLDDMRHAASSDCPAGARHVADAA